MAQAAFGRNLTICLYDRKNAYGTLKRSAIDNEIGRRCPARIARAWRAARDGIIVVDGLLRDWPEVGVQAGCPGSPIFYVCGNGPTHDETH